MQYSYREGENLILMDTETFDQLPMPAEFIGDQVGFLRENDMVRVVMYEGKPLSVELPAAVELKVTETEPAIKGATAAAQKKGAIVETGVRIEVPSFINVGDVIKIDTTTGDYLSRVTK
jgi:elongation factor P